MINSEFIERLPVCIEPLCTQLSCHSYGVRACAHVRAHVCGPLFSGLCSSLAVVALPQLPADTCTEEVRSNLTVSPSLRVHLSVWEGERQRKREREREREWVQHLHCTSTFWIKYRIKGDYLRDYPLIGLILSRSLEERPDGCSPSVCFSVV